MELLEVRHINAGYGDLQVLFDVSLKIDKGEVVSLVGANGGGKTTLLRILSGLMPVKSGTALYKGRDLLTAKSYQRAALGIAHIPQGRGILSTLTVRENLILGAYAPHVRAQCDQQIEQSFDMFPILRERQNQKAGSLSGGQQQMLAIARALMMRPELLLMDEPSLGLAPIVVEEMFDIIWNVAQQGTSIFIIEQNLSYALSIASRGYVLETGRVAMEGSAKELLDNEAVRKAYLGV